MSDKKRFSKNNGIHRDKLFTGAVSLEKLILDDRNEKHHKAFEKLKKLQTNINEIENELTEFLGDDDPIPNRVMMVGVILDNLLMAIEAELNRAVPIVYDDFGQQG